MSKLLFFDTETTGVDPYTDRVVEAGFLTPGSELITTRINPERPIPAEATAVHGIADADVAGAPTFREIAPAVQALVDGVVLVGYACRRFDTILLDEELRRAGQPGLPRGEDGRLAMPEIDLYQLWQRLEPRTLAGAAARFADVALGEEAHSAGADTQVLPAVLEGMLKAFGLTGHDVAALCALCVPDGSIDRDGKFVRREEDGVVVFNFSQHKGQPVGNHPDFLRWMLGRDFSQETKDIARTLLEDTSTPRRPVPAAHQGGLAL